jgi:putative transcription antitermination factor YqgF
MNSPLLGLDVGTRRIGVALSPNGKDIQPLETITWNPPHTHQLTSLLVGLVKKHEITTVVFGIPLSEDGGTTSQSERNSPILAKIKQALAESGNQPHFAEVSEFNSTQEGRSVFSHLDRDAAAACVILQHYLDDYV